MKNNSPAAKACTKQMSDPQNPGPAADSPPASLANKVKKINTKYHTLTSLNREWVISKPELDTHNTDLTVKKEYIQSYGHNLYNGFHFHEGNLGLIPQALGGTLLSRGNSALQGY